MIFTTVDLPAPFSPTRAWIDPESSTRFPSLKAITEPNDFATLRSSSTLGSAFGDVVTDSLAFDETI